MFWFKKKDNNDKRITFREWYDKHYKDDMARFTVIVKPTGFKFSFRIANFDYKIDYETVMKYGDRKVLHEFLVMEKRCSSEWLVVLGSK